MFGDVHLPVGQVLRRTAHVCMLCERWRCRLT
jgi:hypothetical protein